MSRHLTVVFVAAVVLQSVPPASADNLIRLRLSRPVDATAIGVIAVPRPGGRMQWAAPVTFTGRQDVQVTVTTNSLPPAAKLLVFCRGYQLTVLTFSSLADEASRTRSIELLDLPDVPFAGKVLFPSGENGSRFTLEIGLDMSNVVRDSLLAGPGRFVGGLMPAKTFPAATAKLAADGSFAAMLPDIAKDPASALSKRPVTFRPFRLRNGDSSYTLDLLDANGVPMPRGLTVSASYGAFTLRIAR